MPRLSVRAAEPPDLVKVAMRQEIGQLLELLCESRRYIIFFRPETGGCRVSFLDEGRPTDHVYPTLLEALQAAAGAKKSKVCQRCGEWLPMSHFAARKSCRASFRKWCRACERKPSRVREHRAGISTLCISPRLARFCGSWISMKLRDGSVAKIASYSWGGHCEAVPTVRVVPTRVRKQLLLVGAWG